MKVIRRGKTPDEKKWQGDCTTCKSKVEAVARELKITYDQREDGSFGEAPCPVCGQRMIFYEERDDNCI